MGKVSEYQRGIQDGLRAFAHWREGRQEVGTTGTLLSAALARIHLLHVYDPPDDDLGFAIPEAVKTALQASARALGAGSCEDPECGSDSCAAYVAILQACKEIGLEPLLDESPRKPCNHAESPDAPAEAMLAKTCRWWWDDSAEDFLTSCREVARSERKVCKKCGLPVQVVKTQKEIEDINGRVTY